VTIARESSYRVEDHTTSFFQCRLGVTPRSWKAPNNHNVQHQASGSADDGGLPWRFRRVAPSEMEEFRNFIRRLSSHIRGVSIATKYVGFKQIVGCLQALMCRGEFTDTGCDDEDDEEEYEDESSMGVMFIGASSSSDSAGASCIVVTLYHLQSSVYKCVAAE